MRGRRDHAAQAVGDLARSHEGVTPARPRRHRGHGRRQRARERRHRLGGSGLVRGACAVLPRPRSLLGRIVAACVAPCSLTTRRRPPQISSERPLNCGNAGGRYWDRTSDLFRVSHRNSVSGRPLRAAAQVRMLSDCRRSVPDMAGRDAVGVRVGVCQDTYFGPGSPERCDTRGGRFGRSPRSSPRESQSPYGWLRTIGVPGLVGEDRAPEPGEIVRRGSGTADRSPGKRPGQIEAAAVRKQVHQGPQAGRAVLRRRRLADLRRHAQAPSTSGPDGASPRHVAEPEERPQADVEAKAPRPQPAGRGARSPEHLSSSATYLGSRPTYGMSDRAASRNSKRESSAVMKRCRCSDLRSAPTVRT